MVAFATQVKRRRGTAEQNNEFTGAEGEIVVNLTDKSLRVHDGQTKGGFETLRQNMQNSVNITNCITYIPQDIKLELNNGTLTLKAGSKYYYPNGTGVYDNNTTTAELTLGPIGSYTGQCFIYVNVDSSALEQAVDNTSGSTAPTGNGAWYDTNTNYIKLYLGGSDTGVRYSFPIAIATRTNGNWTSIDQVFNGRGYIGSTKHVLPGVKGLIPNGKNADESLRNIEFTTSSVMVSTGASTDSVIGYFNGTTIGNYRASSIIYNKELNRNIDTITGDVVDMIPYTNIYHQTAGKIDYCTFKQVFHAVDYNDTEFIGHQATPSNKYIELTLGASGATYTAPADGFFIIRATANIAGGYAIISNESIQLTTNPVAFNQGGGVQSSLLVKKGDVVYVWYGNITVNHFGFIYTNGAQ